VYQGRWQCISGIFTFASVAVIATIAEEWFPYDRNDRYTFFSAIAAIIVVEELIWKPALSCTFVRQKVQHN